VQVQAQRSHQCATSPYRRSKRALTAGSAWPLLAR
jgi:hypothetical protein